MTEESPKPPMVGENPTQNTGNIEPSMNVDTSNWKTYRNEKLGFEFKLSDEYSIPENEKNIVGKKKNVILLDPKKTEYLFNSRQGLKLSREVQTTGDSSLIRMRVYPYTLLIESDFEKWLLKNNDTSIYKVGVKTLDNDRVVSFVVRYSDGENSSGFFVDKDKQWVVEIEGNKNGYFLDDQRDYFSAILNSVRF